MKKFAVGLPALLLAVVLAMPLSAQEVTCDDIAFDERVMTAYPAARDACLEIIEHEGVKYAHFKALVHEGPPSMLLRFKHRDETWGPATRVTPQPGFTVYMDGLVLPYEDIKRGREISIYLPEGRWEMAVSGADEVMTAEAEFAPFELEVTAEELPDEVELTPPPEVEESAEAEADSQTAEEAAPAGDSTSKWYWMLLLAAAAITIWMLRKKRQARREG
jgi:hypothetical protein